LPLGLNATTLRASAGPEPVGSGARLRLTVAEMNYATRRVVELQAPWISDDHPSH
jgi:hypothetical protein